MRTVFILPLVGLPLICLPLVAANVHVLDDPASPARVEFDTAGGRITVIEKASQWKWVNPSSGGNPLRVAEVKQIGPLRLDATSFTASGTQLTLSLELEPASGDLTVTLSGDETAIPNGLSYPDPFFASDGMGFSVFPTHGGYVIPVSEAGLRSRISAFGDNQMEWFGGTDAALERAWMAIVETPDDWSLNAVVGRVGNTQVIGPAPRWNGSNNNRGRTPSLLSYSRRLRYRFFASGGYVAMAKHFRAHAAEKGWWKPLSEKLVENPSLERLIGAPVIYLWGDGRSSELLAEMKEYGIEKALIQISVNHLDHQNKFPDANFADNDGFAQAVRSHGYLFGFYDIYQAAGFNPGPPYNGFSYLWPPDAVPDWAYLGASLTPPTGPRADICAQKQADFAREIRLPAHLSQFDVDAYFFDTTNAVPARECYHPEHFATRSQDKANRASLLEAAYNNPVKRLITGTEQGKSYGVPYLHWAEGKIWTGAAAALAALRQQDRGRWDDNAYPSVVVDVVDPTKLESLTAPGRFDRNELAMLLSDGYQVPLWDLVYHDALITTVHWERPHNKFLYTWDHVDRLALLRGQAPLLNLVYRGEQGASRRVPNTVTDESGNAWTTRWSVMKDRIKQTFDTVCRWHEKVALLEMIDHRWLTADRSVQLAEFSADGGVSGQGIVVNFGIYDGAYGVTGETWEGAVRGRWISVAPGGFTTYEW